MLGCYARLLCSAQRPCGGLEYNKILIWTMKRGKKMLSCYAQLLCSAAMLGSAALRRPRIISFLFGLTFYFGGLEKSKPL
jgi:hypothetical protein